MAEFKNILLSEIRPDPNNPRRIFDDHSMQELTDSVRDKGILQPIMVRPNGKGYILVCGERRLRACVSIMTIHKDRDTIPAVIRTLTDEEAFEVQIIENLQRKDVHPMEEAIAYKAYMEKKKVSIDELAAKFAKSREYIAQRLSFNSLIKEFQTDFYAGLLLIGHAVMLARLMPADQKDLLPEIKNHHHKEGAWYESIDEVKDTIEQEIMHELGQAPFDKKDEKLIPKAGSCLLCPKRSGSGLLFADVKEKDRCFDAKCYEAKKTAHLVRAVENIVINNPDMPIVTESHSKMDQEVNKLVQGHKLKPLKQYDDFQTASASTPGAIKALSITGHSAGKIVYVKLQGAAKKAAPAAKKTDGASSKLTAKEIDIEIDRIQTREKRSKELDAEKLWASILEILKDKAFKKDIYNDSPLTVEEKTSLAVAMIIKINGSEEIREIGLNNKIKTISDKDLSRLSRLFIINALVSNNGSHLQASGYGNSDNPKAFALINTYAKGPVESLEKRAKEAIDKRIERVSKRISDLRWDKKELENKKVQKKPAAVGIKKLTEGVVPEKPAKKKAVNNKVNTPPRKSKAK